MFQLIRVIILAVRGIIWVSTPTKPSSEYQPGIKGYDKAYFDEYYQFMFFKMPINNMPTNIAIYESTIGKLRIKKPGKLFEIYESNIISEKELAMNVKMAYADFVMTGINSHRNSVANENHFFVLFINDRLKRIEVRSAIEENISEKMIKSDFGEYLFEYLNQQLPQDGVSVEENNPVV